MVPSLDLILEYWIKLVTIGLLRAIFTFLTTVYPKKYAHGFCFVVLCCGYTLADFPISIRLTSLALWQSNDCPSASKATLMNMEKYFMWIHYERLHNHNKAKHNKTVCILLGIYCTIFYRGDPGPASDCPCSVWCGRLTAFDRFVQFVCPICLNMYLWNYVHNIDSVNTGPSYIIL